MQVRKIKIGADGQQLPDEAPEWAAVLLPDHGLMFTRTLINEKSATQIALAKKAPKFELLGKKDWDLPEVDELCLLVDRTRIDPAIDTKYFDVPPGKRWVWSKSDVVGSPSLAWSVSLGNGYVYGGRRGYYGFALAVRRVGQ